MANPEIIIKPPQIDTEQKPKGIVIFIRSLPRHVRDIEAHLRAVRHRYNLSTEDMAEKADISPASYHWVELADRKNAGPKSINKVVGAIGEIADENDPYAIGAVTLLTAFKMTSEKRSRIQEYINDAKFPGEIVFTKIPEYKKLNIPSEVEHYDEDEIKWYNTIKNSPFETSLRYLVVAENLSQTKFTDEAEISNNTLYLAQTNRRRPHLASLNNIIDTSSLRNDGYAAQLLRLKSKGLDCMTGEELRHADIQQLIRYLRIVQGQSQVDFANATYWSKSFISRLETKKDFNFERVATNITDTWLKLGEKSAMREIINQKIYAPNTTISDELIERVMKEKFLIASNRAVAKQPYIHPSYVRLIEVMDQQPTLGNVLEILRGEDINQTQLASAINETDISSKYISDLEHDFSLPKDRTLYLIAKGLGYDIHHPITHYIFKRVHDERMKRVLQKNDSTY
jgi:transcriptional regulator with XRE-family HTH domain